MYAKIVTNDGRIFTNALPKRNNHTLLQFDHLFYHLLSLVGMIRTYGGSKPMRTLARPTILALVVIAFLWPTSAHAYYTTLSGELRDSDTGALWTYGAALEVFNCNTLVTITTAFVDTTGQFIVPIPNPPAANQPLCIEITFASGSTGTPGNAVKGPFPNRISSGNQGNLNTGVYFTGTGPTALTLASFSATAPAADSQPRVLLATLALGALALGFIQLRRRPTATSRPS